MSISRWLRRKRKPTIASVYVEHELDKREVPRCIRKSCGHSALIHEGWPEHGGICYGEDCDCRELIW